MERKRLRLRRIERRAYLVIEAIGVGLVGMLCAVDWRMAAIMPLPALIFVLTLKGRSLRPLRFALVLSYLSLMIPPILCLHVVAHVNDQDLVAELVIMALCSFFFPIQFILGSSSAINSLIQEESEIRDRSTD